MRSTALRSRWMIVTAMMIAATMSTAGEFPRLDHSLHFADAEIGRPPTKFEFLATGSAARGEWQVVADENAREGKALAQLARGAARGRHALAFHRSIHAGDVEITAWLSIVGGVSERAAGVLVRLVDPDNYYAAGIAAFDGCVRFYRVVAGVHEPLAAARLAIPPGEYNALTVLARGDMFRISFNGKVVLTATDPTFPRIGKVGLWTKGDSVTYFDWIVVRDPS